MATPRNPRDEQPHDEQPREEVAFGTGAPPPVDAEQASVWKAPAGVETQLGGDEVFSRDPTDAALGGDEVYPGDPQANLLEEKPHLADTGTPGDDTTQILDTMESLEDV
jgi:hypothetical protein